MYHRLQQRGKRFDPQRSMDTTLSIDNKRQCVKFSFKVAHKKLHARPAAIQKSINTFITNVSALFPRNQTSKDLVIDPQFIYDEQSLSYVLNARASHFGVGELNRLKNTLLKFANDMGKSPIDSSMGRMAEPNLYDNFEEVNFIIVDHLPADAELHILELEKTVKTLQDTVDVQQRQLQDFERQLKVQSLQIESLLKQVDALRAQVV